MSEHITDLDAQTMPPELTIAEKASLTSGSSTWESQGAAGIESVVLSDGPHGLRRQRQGGDALGIDDSVPATCFPPAVGLASTWNDELIESVGRQLGLEARALGVSVLLGPGINIRRSPLGGRNFEYASEDPLVSGRYGVALVRGIQSTGVAATPKHFAANNQETDRFRVSAAVDERTLREIYLPAFERVVRDARPWAMMCAYNQLNGTPASEHHWLLTELLRDEWGFDGVMMSDWGAVDHRVRALMAGLDLEMPPSGSDDQIVTGRMDGTVSDARLDEVAHRMRLLVERTAPSRACVGEVDVESGDRLAISAALESIVLLTNDGTLPLSADIERVAVLGEFARIPRYQGSGSSRVVPTRLHTALDALRARFGQDRVDFASGFAIGGAQRPDDIDGVALADRAVEVAEEASVAIVFVGLPDGSESEGSDRADIGLPVDQIRLLERVVALDTPTVVVMSGGGTVHIGSWRDRAAAIMQGSLLGQGGGEATAALLVGEASPSGKLTESIPLSLSDTPSHLNFPGRDGSVLYGEGVFVGYRWYDTLEREVAFPFGHGLAYGHVDYSNLVVEPTGRNRARVRFTLTSHAHMPVAEIAQLYVRSDGVGRPVHELRGYDKVDLQPGQSREVVIELTERDFALWDVRAHRWHVQPGEYVIEVGASSRDIRVARSISTDGDGAVPEIDGTSTIGEWLDHPVGRKVLQPLVDAIMARFSGEPAPELMAMFLQTPLGKLTSWGVGFDGDTLGALVEAAHAERTRLLAG